MWRRPNERPVQHCSKAHWRDRSFESSNESIRSDWEMQRWSAVWIVLNVHRSRDWIATEREHWPSLDESTERPGEHRVLFDSTFDRRYASDRRTIDRGFESPVLRKPLDPSPSPLDRNTTTSSLPETDWSRSDDSVEQSTWFERGTWRNSYTDRRVSMHEENVVLQGYREKDHRLFVSVCEGRVRCRSQESADRSARISDTIEWREHPRVLLRDRPMKRCWSCRSFDADEE